MCVVSLKELFVSRGVSEPWENEELITCCVCSCRAEEPSCSGGGSSVPFSRPLTTFGCCPCPSEYPTHGLCKEGY